MNTPKLPPLPPQSRKVFLTAIGPVEVLAYSAEDMQAYAIAAIEAQGVPKGWQLVPVEPTQHMLDASALDDQMNTGSIRAAWKDMVNAAPPAPQVVPRKIPTPPAQAEMLDVVYAEGWNQCCDTFFGGLPPQEPVVITITERDEAPAPQAERQPLFADLIANHEGLSEELKAIDAQVDKEHGQAIVVQQEPVAWRTFDGEGGYEYRAFDHNEDYAAEWAKRNPKHAGWVEPLYTHPAQQAKPQPLSDAKALASLLGAALGALRYHTEQTRPIERTREVIRAIEHELAAHGIQGS